jgi:TolB-like protein
MDRRKVFALAGGAIALPLAALAYRILWPASTGIKSTEIKSGKIKSIAVLPLDNLSGVPAQEFFSDGMTDELIGQIARIGSLRVISRTSVMRYKGGPRPSLPQIARELNVDAILEGTVTQSGQKVRITAQLIRARDDRHLWSEEYERDLTDVLRLQSEVARAVAREIRIKLTPFQETVLTRNRVVNPQSYQAFLKGTFFLGKGVPGANKSVESFKEAIRLDPSFAEAFAGLAEALCYVGIFGLRPSAETYSEARTAASRALELDESNAAAHNALGGVKQGYDWDLAGARTEFQRALELNPSHLLTRLWYAECLTRLGRFEETIAESGRALELDVAPNALGNRAMLFFRPAGSTKRSKPARKRSSSILCSSMRCGGRVFLMPAGANFQKHLPA